jgi:hypothetical protein
MVEEMMALSFIASGTMLGTESLPITMALQGGQ